MVKTLKLRKINISLQLLVVVLGTLLFGSWLPEDAQSFFYAISLTLRDLLLFILPAIIFSCLFSCLLSFRGRKAVGFMLLIFALVCVSNYISTLIAYGVASLEVVNIEVLTQNRTSLLKELTPLFEVEFPKWIPNDVALYLGFGLGALFSFFPSEPVYQFSQKARHLVTLFLEKCFIPVLPFFALGFILKMQFDGVLYQVIRSYLPLLLVIICTYSTYLLFLFALAARFNLKQWLFYIKNIIPVALMGFSTMSSLATMPVTLQAAEKNTGDVDLARAIIPATVNIHLIGVSIAIPLMALSILTSFGSEFPPFSDYYLFALYFVLYQFTIATVPGGGILVMIPLLETHFGFTGEMSALITTLYILFDPAITITNVLGNSALVIVISKLFGKMTGKTVEVV